MANIFYSSDYSMAELNSAEAGIESYVERNCTDDYMQILKKKGDFSVFYHLSKLRESLFNWYEFADNASLLEVGGDMGALTGLFCRKCRRVVTLESNRKKAEVIYKRCHIYENLDVIAGKIYNAGITDKFHYIVVTDLADTLGSAYDEEAVSELLRYLCDYLAPGGRILFAVNNRLGMKQFCGEPDYGTGYPFDGINNYPDGMNDRGFSKSEVEKMVTGGGIRFFQFYFPLPDARFPQLIYSQDYLPQRSVAERLINYYQDNSSILIYENDLYKDVIDNNVFPFFSNSFLVECSLQDNLSDLLYAAVTTDRGKKQGFATSIHRNGVVRKRPLDEEGMAGLENCFRNISDIAAHGVPIVPHTMLEHGIEMPFIEHSPLSDELNEIVEKGADAWIEVFDKLYTAILDSPDHVGDCENVLLKEGNPDTDWGVILENAYIDMVPFNCFLINGKLYFFDQEFVRKCFPAKYTLFRALVYSYYFVHRAEEVCSLEVMRERYALNDVWDIFVKIEDEFVERNRNKQIYANFYQYTNLDKKAVYQRGKMLRALNDIQKDEKTNVVAGEKLRAVQLKLIDILTEFAEVCRKNQLTFYPFYGSLIGTLRGNQVIPWDDDIDVAMPREDYDKLLDIAEREFQTPLFLQTMKNDKECFYGGYSKLRDESTTAIELKNWGHSCRQGMCIDIFPLDTVDENGVKRALQIQWLHICQRLMYAKIYEERTGLLKDIPLKAWKRYRGIARIIPHSLLVKLIDKLCRGSKRSKSGYYAILARYIPDTEYILLKKEDFSETIPGRLETVELSVPVGYNRILTKTMGKGFMEFPPEWERRPKHKAIYSLEIPDSIFQKCLYGLWKNYAGEEIVIWGRGEILDAFVHEYGEEHKISFCIDFDSDRLGKNQQGLDVKAPEILREYRKGEIYLIICDLNFTGIQHYLSKEGIEDYYIYMPKKELLIETFQ